MFILQSKRLSKAEKDELIKILKSSPVLIAESDETIEPIKQEPKTAHWKAKSFHELFCDNCGFDFDIMRNDFIDKMNFCPNCGYRMLARTESEEVNEDTNRNIK